MSRATSLPNLLRRRLTRLVISLVVVLTISFLLIQLIPGDPARTSLGPDASAELVAQRRHLLGLDQPVLVQYWHYWGNVLSGRFGTSLMTSVPVSYTIRDGLKNTLVLVSITLIVTVIASIAIGMVLGVATQHNRRPGAQLAFTVIAGLISAIPQFLVAVLLVYFFAVKLRWFPAGGADNWHSFVLPALAITGSATAIMTRVVRSQTTVVLDQDYIRVARAKRLPPGLIYRRHALPNVLTAALTLAGLQLGAVITASIVIEKVFAIPGLGKALVDGLLASDYPVVQAILLLFAAGVLVVTLVVDLIIGMLDPRSNLQER
ncbi:MAG: ABC transporter permease [Actinomycetia bacterium]|nr:ABC transporter permease [Actinomycetes bacterium]